MHVVQFQKLLEGPMEVLLCERVNDLRHSLFHLINCLVTTAPELREYPKVTGRNVWTTGRVRNCLDAHIGQIDYDKDGVVAWCIVLLEMLLTRFEECWPLPTECLLKPQHSNPNPLANQLWCIDFLTPPTPLIIPHRHPAFLESLMPLKNWCSIHARRLKSSLKHSIRFCGIFPSLKQNFIAYRSSKVSDCIFEIHQLWQSGFSRVHSNSCCSCSFEAEIIKNGQSSHEMYSKDIVIFQMSTIIFKLS